MTKEKLNSHLLFLHIDELGWNAPVQRVVMAEIIANLKELDLSDVSLFWGSISLEPYVFQKFVNLEHLNLANNELASLGIDSLKSLKKILNLSNNLLTRLNSNIFEDLSCLENLNCSHNKLIYIHCDVFIGLYNLRKLDLSQNNLKGDSGQIIGLHESLRNLESHRKIESVWF